MRGWACGPPSGRNVVLKVGRMDGLDGCFGAFPLRVRYRERTLENASNPSIRPRRESERDPRGWPDW